MVVSAIGKPVVIKLPSNTLPVVGGDTSGNGENLGFVIDCNFYLVLPIWSHSANSPVPGRTVLAGEPQPELNREMQKAGAVTAQPSHSFISNVPWDEGVCSYGHRAPIHSIDKGSGGLVTAWMKH